MKNKGVDNMKCERGKYIKEVSVLLLIVATGFTNVIRVNMMRAVLIG